MIQNFKNKKILIVGLGLHGGGVGTANFFAGKKTKVIVTDLKTKDLLRPSLEKLKKFKNIKYVLGHHRAKDFLWADLIIKGPGVPNDSKYIKLAERNKIPIDTDVGIFFKICPAPIIGITGSKGKSTTAALAAEMLKQKYKNVVLAGNIRKSVLDILPRINKNSLVVLELSSFQLEGLARHKISPHIAIITNIFREHLNRYKNLREYASAKANIFKFQSDKDYLLINKNDVYAKKMAKSAKSKIFFFEPSRGGVSNPTLPGEHNILNISAAEKVANLYGVPPHLREKAIRNFKGLEGRIQFVAYIKGVKYYNDTTSTMPDAAIAAINSFLPKNKKKIILIAGGSDKKLDFRNLASAIRKNVRHAIFLPGDATEKIKNRLRAKASYFETKSMREAVKKACSLARRGDIVILSPGAASFAQFQHEFERGRVFVDEAKKLKSEI